MLTAIVFARIVGFDYDAKAIKYIDNTTLEYCEDECSKIEACSAYIFDTGRCFLKDEINHEFYYTVLGTTGIKLTPDKPEEQKDTDNKNRGDKN